MPIAAGLLMLGFLSVVAGFSGYFGVALAKKLLGNK